MKYLYFTLGTPGVGKSTWLKEVSHEIYGDDYLTNFIISPDNVRKIVSSPELYPDGKLLINPANEAFVWEFIQTVLDKKTHNGELIIVDATHSRERMISAYKKYSEMGYRVVAIDFRNYAPLEEIFKRNKNRHRTKFVPEDRIETIYERLKTINVPKWIEVIQPHEFTKHFTDIKYNFDEFKSLTFIGDIHSCSDELQKLLKENNIDPEIEDKENAIIFVGDYFDRGPKAVETFKLLQKLKKNKWVLFLKGNHEEPLEHYKEFMQVINSDVDLWIKEVAIPLIQEGKIENEANPLLLNKLQKSYKYLDQFIEDLKQYPNAFEAFSGFVQGYKIPRKLYKDPKTGFQKIRGTSVQTIKEFFLSDIKYTEVMDFIKRCAQLFYAEYKGTDIVATHGGIPVLPDKTIPTSKFIRGVGKYEDSLLCDETFHRNNPDVISIHGHRNVEQLPVQTTENTFNINGDVDAGLRSVKIYDNWNIEITEIVPLPETLEHDRKRRLEMAKTLNAKKLSVAEESKGIMQLFQDHKYVDVKKLPNNIAAINFTRKAFEGGKWDEFTIKARGLFMAIDPQEELPQDYIIARGYQKFFNLGERFGFSERDISKMAFPLYAYEKANGYLGILSVDNRDPENPKWFIASKTTSEGPFAETFKFLIEPFLSKELMDYMKEEHITLLFEVIHPEFDPHIEKYTRPQLVLLDAVYNDLNFRKKSYDELKKIKKLFNDPSNEHCLLRLKNLFKRLDNFGEFYTFAKDLDDVDLLEQNYIEGLVFEDSVLESPNMFKLKTKWYIFWKRMRTLKERIVSQMKKHNGEIEKSALIKLKEKLHIAEEIQVFNFMYDWALNNFKEFQEKNIIEIREAFHKKQEADLNATRRNKSTN